ncbi:MAG: sigma-54 interaction domain-containing protein [Candidatus Polarisedimenticolia bacterium]
MPLAAATSNPRTGAALDTVIASRDVSMILVERSALQVAATDETILLLGETGVGKDILARRIHESSPRAGRRFVPINCAALPDGLLESELFGHARGAFTGAVETQPGQFEVASGGTIFLDEIGEMSPPLQAKLLRVLQEKTFCRVGGREQLRADVRVVAATNQDLDQAMQTGAFRRDLYYRLSVVCLRIPPLRERPEDIEALARSFAARYALLYNRPSMMAVDDAALAAMRRHPFEGNVRELENLVKRAILLGSWSEVIEEVDRRPVASRATAPVAGAEPPMFAPREEFAPLKETARRAVQEAERAAILRALTSTGWNRRRAARLLQVSYRSLLYKIHDYGILPVAGEPIAIHGAQPVIGAIHGPREGSC